MSKKIKLQFLEFHGDNPRVYKLFCQLTRRVIKRGHKKYSSRTVWHQMRWHTTIVAPDKYSDFKLNDHYTPYYARLFMTDNPKHDGFFETRGDG